MGYGGSEINEAWTRVLGGDVYENLTQLVSTQVVLGRARSGNSAIFMVTRRVVRLMAVDGYIIAPKQLLIMEGLEGGVRTIHANISETLGRAVNTARLVAIARLSSIATA